MLFNDAQYVERGFIDQADTAIGPGARADCEDTDPGSRGLVFHDDGERVEVWSIAGLPRSDAVAIAVGSKYAVMLHSELSEPRRAEIVGTLGLDEST